MIQIAVSGGGSETWWLLEPACVPAQRWSPADGAVQSSSSHVAQECPFTEFAVKQSEDQRQPESCPRAGDKSR